jgi:lysophospholipase L1-like esterase
VSPAARSHALTGVVALLVALCLSGCGNSVPKLPRLGAGAVVLAFGDSLTSGVGVNPVQSYPAALERLIGRKVVASGVPGETTEEGIARLPGVLEEVKPALLILCHGGNDFLRKMGEDAAAANVRAMVRLAKNQGIAVMLIATPKPGFGVAKVKFYEEIARESAIPIEADVLADVLTSSKLKSDLVHPNAEGYAEIAQAVAKVLRKAGAV